MYNIPKYSDIEIFRSDWWSVTFKFDDEDQIQMVVDWCNDNFDQEWTVRIQNQYDCKPKSNLLAALQNFDEDALKQLGSSSKAIHEAVSMVSETLIDNTKESDDDKFDRFYFKDEESMMAFKLRWI